MRLSVKVVARASSDEIVGWMGGTLKVRVRAPATEGRANAAVAQVIADALGLARDQVVIVAGKTAPRKIVQIEGLEESEVHRRLASQ